MMLITQRGEIMKVLGIFAAFVFVFSGSAEAGCNLKEAFFEQMRVQGAPVLVRMYSCDGNNWFSSPPTFTQGSMTRDGLHSVGGNSYKEVRVLNSERVEPYRYSDRYDRHIRHKTSIRYHWRW